MIGESPFPSSREQLRYPIGYSPVKVKRFFANVRATDRPLPGIGIARNGLVEQVGDAIHELIIDQALAPGERLNITALARQLGVSDTPVREARGRLRSERLLTFEPYVGYAVMSLPTPERLNELVDLRHLL